MVLIYDHPRIPSPLSFKNRHLIAIHGKCVSLSVIKSPYAELTCSDLPERMGFVRRCPLLGGPLVSAGVEVLRETAQQTSVSRTSGS